MKRFRYFNWLLLLVLLLSSCTSHKLTVTGKPKTAIYTVDNKYLGEIGPNGKASIRYSNKEHANIILLSQEPYSNTRIPFGIDYRRKNQVILPLMGMIASYGLGVGLPLSDPRNDAMLVPSVVVGGICQLLLTIVPAATNGEDRIMLSEVQSNDDIDFRTIEFNEPELDLTNVGKPASSSIEPSREWTGTGFALEDGYIVTNHHVVDGAMSIVILGVNGNATIEYSAHVVGVDKNNDLAILAIDDSRFSGFGSVPYAVQNSICEVGEEVFVLGYPLTTYMGDEIKLTNGIISSKTGFQGEVGTYQISAPVQPGNSGAPLFDSKGNVVGIVNAGIPGAENVGYAIKTTYLYNLVQSVVNSSIIPQNNSIMGSSLADKVRQVKNHVFFIKCKGE